MIENVSSIPCSNDMCTDMGVRCLPEAGTVTWVRSLAEGLESVSTAGMWRRREELSDRNEGVMYCLAITPKRGLSWQY